MNQTERKKREREYFWEWFRHSEWSTQCVSPSQTATATAVSRILNESSTSNCLFYLCGFGTICNLLNQKGHSVIGYDVSESAINGAQTNSLLHSFETIFIKGEEGKKLPEIIPHKISAVYSNDILYEQNWHELKSAFSEIFDILSPGGIFIFAGASEFSPFATDEIAEYDNMENESIEWSYRDGKKLCTKVFSKSNTEIDYRDFKNLYIINDGDSYKLECIEKRIPGYWNYHNLNDLARETGFSHFESRTFSEDGIELIFNVAYKNGTTPQHNPNYAEEQAYRDF